MTTMSSSSLNLLSEAGSQAVQVMTTPATSAEIVMSGFIVSVIPFLFFPLRGSVTGTPRSQHGSAQL
jgi:hypothetical protein